MATGSMVRPIEPLSFRGAQSRKLAIRRITRHHGPETTQPHNKRAESSGQDTRENQVMAELSRDTFDVSKEISRPAELCPSECRTSWIGASRIRLEMVQRKEVQGIGHSGMAQDNRKFQVRRDSSRRR